MPPLTVQAASGATANESTGSAWSLMAVISAVMMALGIALVWRRQPNCLLLIGLMAALVVGLVALGWYRQRPLSLAAQFDESPTAVTAVNQGELLFVAKGCIQCHQNGKVKMADNLFQIGSDLTDYEASS